MIPGGNITIRKSHVASTELEGLQTLKNVLGPREHLDWFQTDLNVTDIITVQDYKRTKKIMWIEVHIYSVKANSQFGNIWVKDLMITQKGQSQRKLGRNLENLCILPENSAEGFESRWEHCWGYIYINENTIKKLSHLPPKSCCNFT